MNINLQTTTNKLVLDFHQRNCQTVLAKEYDKGSRFIPIQCTENGEFFALDSSIEIQVKVLTPDNRALLEHSAIIQNDGSILLELTENMLYYPGKATVELIFYDFEHKKRLSPMKFDLLIDSSAYPDDRVISSDEFNALTDLLEKANADYTYVITAARESADAAKISEDNAAASADIASTKASESNLSALNAQESADSAAYSASCAYHSETISETNATSALNSAKEAQSWAHGNTGIREDENTNNSKYWSEQSKEYADSWKGSLLPQGTISFSQIPTNGNITGHMYNINEAFMTDSRFKDGSGYSYPAGTNIYWTQDGKWDCLSGTLTMTLTQAEYDNLSNAEKMNGTIYYINDADNSIGNANENVAGLMSQRDKKKLDGIAEGAEVNVQVDWNITDSNSDAYIKNKPQSMKNPASLNISLNGISQGAYDGSSQKNVNITAENVGADLSGTATTKVSEHNSSEAAHADIRNLVTTLTNRFNALANSDDTTLDQFSEIVAYIKNNKTLIDGITTSKVNVSDIVDNLTSSVTNKPLSAKQGRVLKDLMTTLMSTVDGKVNKAGDTMTGDLGITYNPPNTSTIGTPAVGGAIISDNLTDLSNYRGFLGTHSPNGNNNWNHVISVRHRNGFGDGRNYGMYLRTPITTNEDDSNLYWRMQNTGWRDERTLLDSYNYKKFCLPLSGGSMDEGAWINFDSGSELFNGGIMMECDDYLSQYTTSELKFHYEKPTGAEDNYYSFTSKIKGNEGFVFEGIGGMVYQKISIFKDGIQFFIDANTIGTKYNDNAITFSNYFIIYNSERKGIQINKTYVSPWLYGNIPYMDLGANQDNMKWKNIYAQNGTIQTSDKTKKRNINNLDIQKMKLFINGLTPCSYEMIDGTSGRTHYGFIAQDVEELMNTLGMTSNDFAGFIKSPKKIIKYEDGLKEPIEEIIDGEYNYSLRYDEFIAPLITVVQEQQKIIENQQKEIEQIKKDISKVYSPM